MSQNCSSDSNCSDFLYQCILSTCMHKNLFPLAFLDFITLILIFVSSIITTVAGVGGGIFFFPILMGVINFSPTEAVAISLSVVAFLMIIRYIMSIKERHPIKDRPMINYDIAVIYCPSSIVGTIFGVLINRVSPNWFLLTLISISMFISMKETWKKAQNQKALENSSQNNQLINRDKELEDLFTENNNNEISSELQKIIEEEKKNIPLKKFLILSINLIVLILILLFQGSKTNSSLIGIPFCEAGYWIFLFLYIPIGAVILYYTVKLLNHEHEVKSSCLSYNFIKSDIKWDLQNIKKSLILGFLIGFTSAILGVGGAVITSPVLIGLGFDAREATYTATFIAVFTSIAGSIQYMVAGVVRWDYWAISLSLGLGGLWIGMKKLLEYVKRTNKSSIIMYTLVFCIGLSMILIAIPGIFKTINDYENGNMMKLRSYC